MPNDVIINENLNIGNSIENIEQFGGLVNNIYNQLSQQNDSKCPSFKQISCFSIVDKSKYNEWAEILDESKSESFRKIGLLIPLTTTLIWGHLSVDNFFIKQADSSIATHLPGNHPLIHLATLGFIFTNAGKMKHDSAYNENFMKDGFSVEGKYLGFIRESIINLGKPDRMLQSNIQGSLYFMDISEIQDELAKIGRLLPAWKDIYNRSTPNPTKCFDDYLKSERCHAAITTMYTLFQIDITNLLKR